MPMRCRRCRTPSLSISALSVLAITLSAQNADAPEPTPRSAALVGGVYIPTDAYVAKGTVVGMRFTFPTSRTMLVEPGIEYVALGSNENASGGGAVMTELQVQAQFGEQVRPFVGVGGGLFAGCGGICAAGLVLSASAGARVPFSNGWGGRLEVRLRGIDSPTVTATELTLG